MKTSVDRRPWLTLACGSVGLLTLFLALLRTGDLSQGTPGGRLFVLLSLGILAALALLILSREGVATHRMIICLLPVALALFIRVFLLDHITYDYQDFLSHWAAFFRENGGFSAVQLPVGNYNAPYLYFLAAISYLDVPDLYLIKLFSVLFDVVLAWGGFRLVRAVCPGGELRPILAFCALLLLPTVLLNGAYWGQCDSIYVALLLHAFASALTKKPTASVFLLAVAFSFKLQTVFLMPLWCVLFCAKRLKFRHLLWFPVGYLATILPALLLGKPLADILGVYFGQTVEYSAYLTMNAPSMYALIPYGTQVDTAAAARVGILLAFLLVAVVLVLLFFLRDRLDDSALLTVGVLFSVGIPLLLPHMHDRYFFLADVLTVVWACCSAKHIPQAAAVQVASLGAYHAYLVLQYAFPMSWGAILLFLVLFSAFWSLFMQMFKFGNKNIKKLSKNV